MQASKRGSPCLVCGREKDGDCRWNTDVVLCHQGSTHAPPQNLRIGDTIDLGGKPWALVAVAAGFDGQAHVFRPHKGRPKHRNLSWVDRKEAAFDASVNSACAKYAAEQFFAIAQRALDVLEFESAHPDELKESLALIYESERQGIFAQKELQTLCREDKDLKPFLDQVNSTLKQIVYQRKDADSFRKNHLGEVLNNA